MKKKKEVEYTPLMKLIVFDRERPRIGWTPSTKIFSNVALHTDGKLRVRVTGKYEEAVEGRCSIVDGDKVFVYSDLLWHACEAWMQKEKELAELLAQLKKGKVPAELHDYQQAPLLE